MTDYTRFKYSGATPGGDSNDYILFSTVTAFGGKCAHQMAGLHKLVLDLFHTQAGTLKLYRSNDRGTTWTQVTSSAKSSPAAGMSSQYEVLVECFADFKLVWTNGGVAQAAWYVDVALTDERIAPTNDYIAALSGIFADFDAAYGVTLNGSTVSAWTDKENGHVVQQGTAAQQAAYSASHASMNGRPALTFDGTNDSLVSNEAPAVWKFLGGDQVSIYVVHRIAARGWNPVVTTENNVGGGDISGIMLAAREAGTFANDVWSVWTQKITAGFHATASSPAGDAVVGTRACISYHAPGGLSHIRPSYPDASATALTVLGSPGALDPTFTLNIGGFSAGGTYFNGQISRVLIFSRALSEAEDAGVSAQLYQEYDIP